MLKSHMVNFYQQKCYYMFKEFCESNLNAATARHGDGLSHILQTLVQAFDFEFDYFKKTGRIIKFRCKVIVLRNCTFLLRYLSVEQIGYQTDIQGDK